MRDLRIIVKAFYLKYKMNVYKCVLDCFKYVENLVGWNICVKGIRILISEFLRGV